MFDHQAQLVGGAAVHPAEHLDGHAAELLRAGQVRAVGRQPQHRRRIEQPPHPRHVPQPGPALLQIKIHPAHLQLLVVLRIAPAPRFAAPLRLVHHQRQVQPDDVRLVPEPTQRPR